MSLHNGVFVYRRWKEAVRRELGLIHWDLDVEPLDNKQDALRSLEDARRKLDNAIAVLRKKVTKKE